MSDTAPSSAATSLVQMRGVCLRAETITKETTTNQNMEFVESGPDGYVDDMTSTAKAPESLRKRGRDCKSQIIREFAMRLCLLGMSEATPANSCHHGRLNTS